MKRIAWNFAASSIVLGATTVGCVVNGVGTAPASAYQARQSDQQAAALFQRAGRAIADKRLAEAISLLEQAVALSPRDAGYRLMLADAYMKSGRFQSAEGAYRDVLVIDPERTRAALGLALMKVANGRQQEAMNELQKLEGVAAPADLGLAYALAGAPGRAVDLLEPAARSMGATARVRQNLALAYAFGGDWTRARTIAAQDVSPAELNSRMMQWAQLAQRVGAPEKVAAMLGVSPVVDQGQPVQLALAPMVVGPPAVVAAPVAASAAPVVFAEAQAAVEPPMPTDSRPAAEPPVETVQAPAPISSEPKAAPVVLATARPIAFAEAAPAINPPPVPEPVSAPALEPVPAPIGAAPDPAPEPVPAPVLAPAPAAPPVDYAELEAPEWGLDERGNIELPAPAPPEERAPAKVQYAAAAETLVRPDPVVMPVVARAARALAPVATRAISAGPLPGKRSAEGRYVVQIGAFSSAANADRAWKTYEKRFGLAAEQPVTMTIDHRGRLLHRAAISGFVTRKEASQVCNVIRIRGGECFVRGNAGDASIDWAARYTRRG